MDKRKSDDRRQKAGRRCGKLKSHGTERRQRPSRRARARRQQD